MEQLKDLLKALFKGNISLLKGSGQSFLIHVASLVISFVLQIFLARILGTSEYGIYVYALAWINSLTLFCKLGLDQAAKKFIPAYRVENEQSKLFSFIRYSQKRVFIFSSCVAVAALIVLWLLPQTNSLNLEILFLAGALLLIVNTQLHLLGSFLEALKQVLRALIPLHVIRPLFMIIGLLILIKMQSENAKSMMIANVFSTIVALFISYRLFKKSISFGAAKKFIDREWIKVALPLLLTSGIHLLLTQTDVILVGLFIDTFQAGIYASAGKISQLVIFGATAVNVIAAPLISEHFTSGDSKKLQRMVSVAALLTAGLSLPLILFFILFSEQSLLLFGEEFTAGSFSLKILLIGQVVNAVAGSVGFLMTLTKFHLESLYILISAAIVNIILNVILIPLYGIEGAAIATGVTTIFWNLCMYIFIHLKLKIDSSVFGLLRN